MRFKVQNTAGEYAHVAAYVDARLVLDRLDLVCGSEWTARFEELPKPLLPAAVRPRRPAAGAAADLRPLPAHLLRHQPRGLGEGEDPKSAFSDAIKRAAVHFGVGRALYAMRAPWVREGDADGELRRNRRGGLALAELEAPDGTRVRAPASTWVVGARSPGP